MRLTNPYVVLTILIETNIKTEPFFDSEGGGGVTLAELYWTNKFSLHGSTKMFMSSLKPLRI